MIARYRLVIERLIEGNEYEGTPEDTWALVRNIWGDIKPIHDSTDDRERNRAGRMEAHVTHKILTPYFEGYSSAFHILKDIRIFEVESVINIGERNRILEWLVVETL